MQRSATMMVTVEVSVKLAPPALPVESISHRMASHR